MRCNPLSVSTMPDISPTLSEKVPSSNGFCMAPRPNGPKSPLLRKEPQSERAKDAFEKASTNSCPEREDNEA